ncbi:hypothetical protein BGX38DRAFT_1146165 [Terfezia claveryi]|nr:hypothetical protein BGX38DRAFT_1146165 [Terfezia claveryi]
MTIPTCYILMHHRQYRAGRAHLVDLNDQRVSVVGEKQRFTERNERSTNIYFSGSIEHKTLGHLRSGKSNFFGELSGLFRDATKPQGKGRGVKPRVELPVITKKKRSTTEQRELERQGREIVKIDRAMEEREREAEKRRAHEQEGDSSEDDVGVGPCVGKGNPRGFLDTDGEAEIDRWGREEKKKRHMVSLVAGEGAPEGTGFDFIQAILGEDGSVEFEGRDDLSKGVDVILKQRNGYLTELDYTQDRETELEREIGILMDQVKNLSTRGDAERELVETKKRKRQERGQGRCWFLSGRNGRQRVRHYITVEMVSVATQSDHIKAQVEVALQMEVEIEKKEVRDTEDIVMADRSDMYEDYEDEGEAPVVVAPLTTKKQAALRPAAKAGKNSQPAKTPPPTTSPSDNRSKVIVIHGISC